MKKLLCFLMAIGCTLGCMTACGGGDNGTDITVTQTTTEYDIISGDNYTITVDLGESVFSSIRIKTGDSDAFVSSSNYIYDSNSGTIVFLANYLASLPVGDNVFIVKSRDASEEFTVTIVQSQTASVDVAEKTYAYGSGNAVAFDCNFGSATVSSVKLSGKTVSANNYTYADNTLTFSSDYCNYLYGKNTFTVELSNNFTVEVSITSSAVFVTDFDNVTCNGEWNFNMQTSEIVTNGIGGTKSMRLAGNGGSTLLMGTQFFAVDFDTTKTYKLIIKVKNLWSVEEDGVSDYQYFGFNLDDAAKSRGFIYHFSGENLPDDALTVTQDADGVFSFEYTFVPSGETYFEGFFGYDGSNPTKKIFDVLIDDIAVFVVE